MATIDGKRSKLLGSLAAISLGLLLLALGFLRHLGSQFDEIGKSCFGKRVIQLSNGSRVYLKRETRGLNFDVVSISENPNKCESANPDTDLIFKYDANPLAVAQSDDALIIYWAWAVNQPKFPLAHVVVKNVRPDSLSPQDMASLKVQLIDIPLEFEKRRNGDCTRK